MSLLARVHLLVGKVAGCSMAGVPSSRSLHNYMAPSSRLLHRRHDRRSVASLSLLPLALLPVGLLPLKLTATRSTAARIAAAMQPLGRPLHRHSLSSLAPLSLVQLSLGPLPRAHCRCTRHQRTSSMSRSKHRLLWSSRCSSCRSLIDALLQ